MYEDIQVKKKINWKTAFTKLGVLALFIIILALIIVLPSKKTYAESEYEHNLRAFMNAAKEHFKGNLPSEVGNVSTIKLQDLIEEKKLKNINLERENCNKEQSYAKITKISKKEYSVYVYLECSKNQASSVDTIIK